MTDEDLLGRYLVPLRRWWPVVAAAVGLGLIVGFITLPDLPDQPEAEQLGDRAIEYRATHVLVRDHVTPDTANTDLMLLLARQGDVTNRVANRMGDRIEIDDVLRVNLEPDDGLGTVSITAVQPSSELAAELATTYAEEFTAYFDERDEESLQERIDRSTRRLAELDVVIRDLQERIEALPPDDLDRRLLESQLDVLIAQFGPLQAELNELNMERSDARSTFRTLEVPSPVSTAAPPGQVIKIPEGPRARVALAAAVALLIGIAIVFVIDRVDTRIRTRKDAEAAFGLPVIAELPRRSRQERRLDTLPVRTSPESPTAEAFRALRLSVIISPRWRFDRDRPVSNGHAPAAYATTAGGEPKSLLVTSALTGEGKSTVAANLAVSFAESGKKVLVIDLDFRRPSVAKLLEAEGNGGLQGLTDPQAGTIGKLIVPSAVPGVVVLPSGPPGLPPPWFLSDGAVIVQQAKNLADVIICDTGPLVGTTEATSLIPAVDTVLLVTRAGRLSGEGAERTRDLLMRTSAEIAGVVLIGGDGHRPYSYDKLAKKATGTGEPGSQWTAESGLRS